MPLVNWKGIELNSVIKALKHEHNDIQHECIDMHSSMRGSWSRVIVHAWMMDAVSGWL